MVPFLQHSPNDNTVETENRAEKEWLSEVRDGGEVDIEGHNEASLFWNSPMVLLTVPVPISW